MATRSCSWSHCKNQVIIEGKRKGAVNVFCSRACKRKFYADANRRKTRERVIAYLGGHCVRCGWNEHYSGFVTHHLDPNTKVFNPGNGNTKAWAKIEEELRKCVLMCCNCHNIVHALDDEQWVKGR